MTILFLTYFTVALAILAGLVTMILKIGAMMGTCPISNGAARAASITIATGYSAIGLGGVTLAAILVPALIELGPIALLAALGGASLALGLGFTQAVATLRGVVTEVVNPPAPEAKTVQKPEPEGIWDGVTP